MTRRECDETLADHLEKQVRRVEHRGDIVVCHGGERLIDLLFGANANN